MSAAERRSAPPNSVAIGPRKVFVFSPYLRLTFEQRYALIERWITFTF